MRLPLLGISVFVMMILLQADSWEQQKSKYRDWRSSEFRYLIYANHANFDDPAKPIQRQVYLLLKEKAFSAANLKKLFALISRRFPQPDWLEVWVRTSLMQIGTPEEQDEPLISESPYIDPHEDEHPEALMIRIQDNEILRYTPSPPYINMDTMSLREAIHRR